MTTVISLPEKHPDHWREILHLGASRLIDGELRPEDCDYLVDKLMLPECLQFGLNGLTPQLLKPSPSIIALDEANGFEVTKNALTTKKYDRKFLEEILAIRLLIAIGFFPTAICERAASDGSIEMHVARIQSQFDLLASLAKEKDSKKQFRRFSIEVNFFIDIFLAGYELVRLQNIPVPVLHTLSRAGSRYAHERERALSIKARRN